MVNLVGVWGVLFAILVGWGLATSWCWRRLAPARYGKVSTFQLIWIGLGGVIAALELLSFVLPVAEIAIALLCLPALAGYIACRREIAAWLRTWQRMPRTTVVLALVIAVVTLTVALAASGPVQLYDTGLYHQQAVKWMTHYRIVPGLANLHMRFGYNNSIHLFGALADALWEGMAIHIANSFFAFVVIAQCFVEIIRARSPRGRLRQVFCLVALPYFLSELWTLDLSSLSSDLPLSAIAFALVLELLTETRRELGSIATLMTLGALALTTKLGGAALFVVVAGISVWQLRAMTWRVRAVVFLVPAILVLGWLVRGIVTSGWLLYPVFGHLPISWAVPHAIAHNDLENIESWARMKQSAPEVVFGHGFWFWFAPWFEVFKASREFLLAIVASAFAVARISRGRLTTAERIAYAACGLALVQWFVGAPLLRYGAYLFWLSAAAVLAPLLAPAMRSSPTRLVVLAVWLAFARWAGAFDVHLPATPKLWGRLPAPVHVPTSRSSTPNGDVNYPDHGDQCWDAPLPCTPTLDRARYRVPEDLGAGFVPLTP